MAAAPQNICSAWDNPESQGVANRNIAVRRTLRRLLRKILQMFGSAAAAPPGKHPQPESI